MLRQRTRGVHAEAWKAGREKACRNAGMNVNVRACVKEKEVKESVRIELVKALRQTRFILTGEIKLLQSLGHQAEEEWNCHPPLSFLLG
jgi:hypothetical protein